MPGISNNEIKRIRSLSVKKFRDQEGLFTVEGEKMVSEARESAFHIEAIYRTEEIGQEAMSRISVLSSPSPVLAVVRKPDGLMLGDRGQILSALVPAAKGKSVHEVFPERGHTERHSGLFLALDTIRDPGNLGTILRIADWFGIDAVFASPDTVDIFNPKVVQATMGAIFRVRFHYAGIADLAHAAIDCGGHVYGTFLDGGDIYGKQLDCGADSPSVIVIGNESNGISPEVAAAVSDRLFIPPYPAGEPGSESLNAAIATAVTVAEFRRRGMEINR